jgi:hypothetical protein
VRRYHLLSRPRFNFFPLRCTHKNDGISTVDISTWPDAIHPREQRYYDFHWERHIKKLASQWSKYHHALVPFGNATITSIERHTSKHWYLNGRPVSMGWYHLLSRAMLPCIPLRHTNRNIDISMVGLSEHASAIYFWKQRYHVFHWDTPVGVLCLLRQRSSQLDTFKNKHRWGIQLVIRNTHFIHILVSRGVIYSWPQETRSNYL